jgi:hypothetical protein
MLFPYISRQNKNSEQRDGVQRWSRSRARIRTVPVAGIRLAIANTRFAAEAAV